MVTWSCYELYDEQALLGMKQNQPSLIYLCFSSGALLHCTPGKGSTRSEGLEGCSKDIANPKSYQLLQPGQRETITILTNAAQ